MQSRHSSEGQWKKYVPPAPPGFDPGAFFADRPMHQQWEMFQGVFTPGHNDINALCILLGIPEDLRDMRVLDVGAWDGCLSFECERRRAAEVVAIGPEDPARTGFRRIHDLLGSRVHYRRGTVYDLDPDVLGTFDVVLFCGVLYHLRYPLLGIDNLRRVCRGEVYAETYVCDADVLRGRLRRLKSWALRHLTPLLSSSPLWVFYRTDELCRDHSNWFGPNVHGVVEAFESAGFDAACVRTWGDRAGFRARVRPGKPEFLEIPSGEGFYYDVLVKHLFGNRPFQAPVPPARAA